MKKKMDIVVGDFLHMDMRTIVSVPIIAVYEKPLDYPDKYVARLWGAKGKPTSIVVIKDSLEEIRNAIPRGMHRLGATSLDDPVLIETYI